MCYRNIAKPKSIAPPKILLVFVRFRVSANQRSMSATRIAIINVFSVIVLPPFVLIILYTIFKINQVILFKLTEFKKIKNIVEIQCNLFYNIFNLFIMGEFVVSPILLLAREETMFTATVVIAGISIVLGVLLLLILIFGLFGKIVPMIEKLSKSREQKKAEKKAKKQSEKNGAQASKAEVKLTPSPVPVKAPTPAPVPVVQQGISQEVVAAITAAVVATEGSGAVIRSIKKKNVGGRNPWSAAATIDNTRPF